MIAIFAPNVPEYAIVFLGALQMGAVVTGVNPLFTSDELTKQLRESNAKCVFTVHQLTHRAEEAARELAIKQVFVIGDDRDDDNCDSVSALFKDDGSGFPQITFFPKDDLAILPFSSGAGGLPRGVMLTHYNLVALGCIVSADGFLDLKDKVSEQKSTVLSVIPFHRTFGMVAVLSLALHHGSTLISMPRFDKNKFFPVLQDYKVSRTLYLYFVFAKSFPCSHFFSRNLAKTLQVLARDILSSVEIGRLRTRKKNCEPGEAFVKICRVKKHVCERRGACAG